MEVVVFWKSILLLTMLTTDVLGFPATDRNHISKLVDTFRKLVDVLIGQIQIQHITSRNSVWFPENFYDNGMISTSDNQILYWGLNLMTVEAIDLVNQEIKMQYKLPLPGNMISVSPNGQYVAVAHKSYVTIINPQSNPPSSQTYTVPVEQACSLIATDSGIVFIWAAYDQWTNIACLDSKTGHYGHCPQQTYAGAMAFLDGTGKSMYSFTQGLSPQSIEKYVTNGTCLRHVYDNPDFGTYSYGRHAWFSYDNSRMFLDNGRTLTVAPNQPTDMTIHGCINSSCVGDSYTWVNQENISPFNVYALKTSGDLSAVNVYSWPYLNAIDRLQIPNRTEQGVEMKLLEPLKIHWWENSLYTIAHYNVSGVKQTGIGRIDMKETTLNVIIG